MRAGAGSEFSTGRRGTVVLLPRRERRHVWNAGVFDGEVAVPEGIGGEAVKVHDVLLRFRCRLNCQFLADRGDRSER